MNFYQYYQQKASKKYKKYKQKQNINDKKSYSGEVMLRQCPVADANVTDVGDGDRLPSQLGHK